MCFMALVQRNEIRRFKVYLLLIFFPILENAIFQIQNLVAKKAVFLGVIGTRIRMEFNNFKSREILKI